MFFHFYANSLILEYNNLTLVAQSLKDVCHACHLQDSAVDVIVGLRTGSSAIAKAEDHRLLVACGHDLASADVVMILTPMNFRVRYTVKK
jgi:ketol-acid reductoisomerase